MCKFPNSQAHFHGGTNLDVPPTPFLKFLLYRFSDD